MTRSPDVTVIMAAYNGVPYIERALESLTSQTIGEDRMQVIVIDDGSTDETGAVLDRTAAAHPDFEVIHQQNFGRPAGPRNRALGLVRGRYVFFLDQDDYLSSDALEAMVRTADDNGTDVVLGRIKGMGGRGTPRTMFSRTMPRTDVFSSAAYWSLNPLKLFRMDMVRSLGLTFDESAPWGEDQPFVATAYLKGGGISILSDKDYLFWVYRDDRSNITASAVSLSDRMPVVDRMFDLVAQCVPPGPERDRLLQRHFRVEVVDSACEGYRTETEPARRQAAFERFREIVHAYYNDSIERALPPGDRVLMRLVSEDRHDDFAAYLDALAKSEPPEAAVEGDHVYLRLPWFRDPAHPMPDDLFDVREQLRLQCRVEPITIDADGLHLRATCRLGALTDRVTQVDLIARPRGEGPDVVVPLAYAAESDEIQPYLRVDETLTADRLLAGLRTGRYGLFLRVAAGPVRRERRMNECAPPPDEPRFFSAAPRHGVTRSLALNTGAGGGLWIAVSEAAVGWRRVVREARRTAARIAKGFSRR